MGLEMHLKKGSYNEEKASANQSSPCKTFFPISIISCICFTLPKSTPHSIYHSISLSSSDYSSSSHSQSYSYSPTDSTKSTSYVDVCGRMSCGVWHASSCRGRYEVRGRCCGLCLSSWVYCCCSWCGGTRRDVRTEDSRVVSLISR